jgi:hypothetical protein
MYSNVLWKIITLLFLLRDLIFFYQLNYGVEKIVSEGKEYKKIINFYLRVTKWWKKWSNITTKHGQQADTCVWMNFSRDGAAATRLPAEPVEPKLRVELFVESRDSMEPAPVGPFRLLKAAVRPTGLRLTPMATSSRWGTAGRPVTCATGRVWT